MGRSVHKIIIPSSTRYLEDVRRFIERHAVEANLTDDSVEKVKMAVDEACTNVIKHAYHGNTNYDIDIAVIVAPDKFSVRIRDEGQSFDPASYHTPNILDSIRHRKPGGYGVHIIRKLMDQVEYRTRGNVNEVTMTKFRLPKEILNGEDNG